MPDDVPDVVSPYARARQLQAQQIPIDQIQKTLIAEGVDADSALIVVRALRGTGAAEVSEDFGPPAPMPVTVQQVAPAHPCPTHADFPVTGSCSRCGNFFCGKCVQVAKLASDDSDSTRCPECRVKFPVVTGIGGWLVLPALHQVLTIIGLLWGLLTDVRALAGDLRGTFVAPVMVETVLMAGRLAFTIVVALNFFRRKRRAVGLCIAFYLVGFAFALIQAGLQEWTVELGAKASASDGSLRQTVLPVIAGVLWITYFMRSKRVEATFIVD